MPYRKFIHKSQHDMQFPSDEHPIEQRVKLFRHAVNAGVIVQLA